MNTLSRGKTCCFTGYRPEKLPWGFDEGDPRCARLAQRLYDFAEALYLSGIRRYLCGMALGSDMLFCQAVIRLRALHLEIVLEAAIPFPGQSDRWPEQARERYLELLHGCSRITVLSEQYTPACMRERNEYMVNQSSVLVAVYDGKRGGTMMTVNYAKKQGLEILQIMP